MNGLRRFRRDCKGGVAVIFALSIVPLIAVTGAAVDLTRGVQRRNELQAHVDAALLYISRQSVTLNDTDVQTKIRSYILSAGYPASELGTVTITRNGQSLSATANAKVSTTLMKLMQVDELKIQAKASARWMQAEVVLVLDNSGSMAGNRLTMLQTAVKDFIDKSAGTDGAIKYGLVPFAQGVRVPVLPLYKDAEWIDWGGDADSEDGNGGDDDDDDDEDEDGKIKKSEWKGCLVDRPKPYNDDDSYYQTSKKYPAIQKCRSNESGLGLVQDLGTSTTNLKTAIDNMGAGGNTNMTIGVAWGHAMLSKQVPFTQTLEDSGTEKLETRRILILMTDGENTKSQHSTNKASNDGWTKDACTSAKSDGIEIYSVGFIGGDDAVLTACASPGNHITAATLADIGPVFHTLALAVRKPNLTH